MAVTNRMTSPRTTSFRRAAPVAPPAARVPLVWSWSAVSHIVDTAADLDNDTENEVVAPPGPQRLSRAEETANVDQTGLSVHLRG